MFVAHNFQHVTPQSDRVHDYTVYCTQCGIMIHNGSCTGNELKANQKKAAEGCPAAPQKNWLIKE